MPVTNKKTTFEGKKVLITGAGRGIGRAVALELYSQGATIFALSKNEDNLKSLKTECPNIHTICVDLSDWDETKSVLENNVDHVDALINNAAICASGELHDITPESFDRIFNVNVKSVINVSQVISKKMIAKGKGGSIVNISSIGGKKAFTVNTVYCCSKAAMEMLTKCMAIELGPHKITVNSVCPGPVDTDMLRSIMDNTVAESGFKMDSETLQKSTEALTPTKTFYMPMEDVVNAIAFFASGVTSQITGGSICVDGGLTAV